MSAKNNNLCLSLDNINPCLKKMTYGWLSPLDGRAKEIEKELSKGIMKPFEKIVNATLGDSQAMGQMPMTYIRQVLALVSLPHLMNDSNFPDDMKRRAAYILKDCRNGTIGSYSNPCGLEVVRRNVAQYIERRDNIPSDWQDIVLTSGATDAIKYVLKLFHCDMFGKKPGVLTPVPQYPLYNIAVTELDMVAVGYYLNQSDNWKVDVKDLKRAIDESREYCNSRILVIINPGNPTGQVLSKENLEEVVKFAYQENLFIFADEVYQGNVHGDDCQFHSIKKVMTEMGEPYTKMELASFMSGSKGYMGECGIRGGYVELTNVLPEIHDNLKKFIYANLCPNIYGQVLMDCMANPPQPGEPSYDVYIKEKTQILQNFKYRAKLINDTFSSLEYFNYNPIKGALYAFPEIKLPPKAIEAANRVGMPPDTFYAMQLLEKCGMCIVPGNCFGQKPGTYFFRTTILPPADVLKDLLIKFTKFHKEFIQEYI